MKQSLGLTESQEQDIERQATKEWNQMGSRRAEYADNFQTFLSYKKAQTSGRVKILGEQGGNVDVYVQSAPGYRVKVSG